MEMKFCNVLFHMWNRKYKKLWLCVHSMLDSSFGYRPREKCIVLLIRLWILHEAAFVWKLKYLFKNCNKRTKMIFYVKKSHNKFENYWMSFVILNITTYTHKLIVVGHICICLWVNTEFYNKKFSIFENTPNSSSKL